MQILSNLDSVEYTTKTKYLLFKLINFIVFVQIYSHFELDVCNTFQNTWDGGQQKTGKVKECLKKTCLEHSTGEPGN